MNLLPNHFKCHFLLWVWLSYAVLPYVIVYVNAYSLSLCLSPLTSLRAYQNLTGHDTSSPELQACWSAPCLAAGVPGVWLACRSGEAEHSLNWGSSVLVFPEWERVGSWTVAMVSILLCTQALLECWWELGTKVPGLCFLPFRVFTGQAGRGAAEPWMEVRGEGWGGWTAIWFQVSPENMEGLRERRLGDLCTVLYNEGLPLSNP